MFDQEWSVGVHQANLVFVNGHWATFSVHISSTQRAEMSEPLDKVLLSWDNQRQRPKVGYEMKRQAQTENLFGVITRGLDPYGSCDLRI
jgi:hypothetical protein